MKKIKVGVPGMDELLFGGLPVGFSYLVSGSCGSGKTIFASHFISQGLKDGESCLYISFEIEKDKLIALMGEIGIDFASSEKKKKLKVIGGLIGQVSLFKEKANAKIDDLIMEVREVVEDMGVKRVVLDSVNLFLMLFDGEREKRHALTKLISVLNAAGCTTVLTCEVEEGSKKLSWYGFEEFVVDGVIALYRIPFDNFFERAAAVIKMRGTKHSPKISALQIREDGMSIFPGNEPYHKPLNMLGD